MATTWLDITEILENPLFTGIQRIERKLIENWHAEDPLVPIVFDRNVGQFVQLPEQVLSTIANEKVAAGDLVKSALNRAVRVNLVRGKVLNLELFFCRHRAKAYIDLARTGHQGIYWVAMDFLPHLKPEHFHQGAAEICMPYLRAIRQIPNVGFISKQTKCEYSSRIAKCPQSGPVLLLGGDSVELDRQQFSPARNAFLAVGTIEPRKNHAALFEAFDRLWERGIDCELHVVGREAKVGSRERALQDKLECWPWFHYHGVATDKTIASLYERARATIFLSESEGFGLPPYESLSAGVPVICSGHGVPSLASISQLGQIRLSKVSTESVLEAVENILDDEMASLLWMDASQQDIPTWRNFTHNMQAWLQAGRPKE